MFSYFADCIYKKREEKTMEYSSVVVDELGEVVAWCKDLTQEEIEKVLNESPEYKITCIVL